MRAPKGGAGPRLQITYRQPSSSPDYLQHSGGFFQTAAKASGSMGPSSRSSAPIQNASKRTLSPGSASDSPSQPVTYTQRYPTPNLQRSYNSQRAVSPSLSMISRGSVASPHPETLTSRRGSVALNQGSLARSETRQAAQTLSRHNSPRAVSPSASLTSWKGLASFSLSTAESLASRTGSPALSQRARYLSTEPEWHGSLNSREQSVFGQDTTRLASLPLVELSL